MVAASLVVGCASTDVVVDSDFPTPLVDPLPVKVGVYFDDELHDFIHVEALPRQSTWTIDLGDANIDMLEPLLGSMFAETTELSSVDPPAAERSQLDGILQPELEDFQFDVPEGDRDEFVEVWMQYKLTLYDADGSLVTEWPVSGYGKHEVGGSREDAVHEAAIVAMREAGAAISTKFADQPDVRSWLEERSNEHR